MRISDWSSGVCSSDLVCDDQRAKLLGCHVGNVEATGAAIALYKGDNGFLGRRSAGGAVLSLAADIGFIGFNDASHAAHTALNGHVHGFADTVGEEPGRLVGDAERTMELVG